MGMEFVGAGIAFPMRTDAIGGVALVAREREIQEAIRLILGTAPGERPMRPEFGCRISEHVFGPPNATTAGQLSYVVRVALQRCDPRIDVDEGWVTLRRWEPRIVVDVIVASFDDAETGLLYIDVGYRIRGHNIQRNLVF